MKRIYLFATILFSTTIFAQKENLINPQGKWYFGAETGLNIIPNYSLDKSGVSLQGGLLAEYYFAKQWSFSGRIKYFKTGLEFYNPNTHTGSWLDLGHDEFYGTFRGAVISIPLDIKWEFRIYKNLKANIKAGYGYNFETKSAYNYSENLSTDFERSFGSVNMGLGLNYFVDEKLAIYTNYETHFLSGSKGSRQQLILNTDYRTQNVLVNVGVKYNFAK